MRNLIQEFGLVTGASGFLGKKHCETVLENGQNLLMIDIKKKELFKFKKTLEKKFPNQIIESYNLDITQAKNIKKIRKEFDKNKYLVTLIINNACIDSKPNTNSKNSYKKILKSWDREFDVSLKASYLIIENFTDKMKMLKKGKIINIASDLSLIAPNQKIYKNVYKNFKKPITYSIIKHGVIGLTKYYAAELGKYNISCNAISPSGVFNNHNKKFVKNLTGLIPMERMASINDIVELMRFLISGKQNYINGQNIVIDGGRTII